MNVPEYVREFEKRCRPLEPQQRALAASCLRNLMCDHVREQLGENPSFADSDVNVVWLMLMGCTIKSLEGS